MGTNWNSREFLKLTFTVFEVKLNLFVSSLFEGLNFEIFFEIHVKFSSSLLYFRVKMNLKFIWGFRFRN